MVQNKVNKETETENNEKEEPKERHVGWAGVHFALAQSKTENKTKDLKKLVLLDTDSNVTVFCERKYVNKVWDVNESMGLGTNGGGSLISTQKCEMPHLGEHWFNADSITNIIAMKDMTDRYRVTLDPAVEKALFVHIPHKIVIFEK